ncbi:MAG TPA: hypothetical protein VGI42_01815, partial [Chthoniobacterales bacterium]
DWIVSARKIYSPALNLVFADAFYDLGWLQNAAATSAPPATETAKVESTPAIEPSPIPGIAVASNKPVKQPSGAAAQKSPATVAGMEATTANTAQSPVASQALTAKNDKIAAAPVTSLSPSVETPVGSNALPAETRAPLPPEAEQKAPGDSTSTALAQQSPAKGPAISAAVAEQSPANSPANKVAPPVAATSVSATPATVLAPASVREWSKSGAGSSLDRFDSNTLLVGGLLLAGIILIVWVIVSELRRRMNVPFYRSAAPATGPRFDAVQGPTTAEKVAAPRRLIGGPPRVSLQLKASEPSVRRGAVPFGTTGRNVGGGSVVQPAEKQFDVPVSGNGETIFPGADSREFEPETVSEPQVIAASAAPVIEEPLPAFVPWVSDPESAFEAAGSFESVGEPITIESEVYEIVGRAEKISEPEMEPVAQGQPIPYQVPATDSSMSEITKPEPESFPARPAEGIPGKGIAGVGALRQSVESPSFAPKVISTEPLAQQPTTPATMPQTTQPTPAPAIRTGPTGSAPQPQPTGGMQTAVQLTFSFEIASLQLTPSFKMGALQLKPTSKIVTMRLAPSQQPQPAMNLQVTFEIATVQLAGGSLGTVRLTPSQQQRPSVISSPAFNIAGLQLLSGAENGAVQLTPAQQGQASVHVTGRFQIASVEFSPSFEIASIVLNSISRSVSVQLPGSGPSAVEGAPVFDIANVQLAGNGEIGMMQLNAHGAAPKPA